MARRAKHPPGVNLNARGLFGKSIISTLSSSAWYLLHRAAILSHTCNGGVDSHPQQPRQAIVKVRRGLTGRSVRYPRQNNYKGDWRRVAVCHVKWWLATSKAKAMGNESVGGRKARLNRGKGVRGRRAVREGQARTMNRNRRISRSV